MNLFNNEFHVAYHRHKKGLQEIFELPKIESTKIDVIIL